MSADSMSPLRPARSLGGGDALDIRSEGDVQLLVYRVRALAAGMGFSEVDCTQLATAASELAMNMLKYAGGGRMRWQGVAAGGASGMEIQARDRGPGIADLELAMREHFSSKGTLGLGLPGTRRLMDEFWIDSAPGAGTQVCVRKWR
ncbi:anti-sigma regulatory factor [Chromobacterium violaceum]|uniref:anti-sigma regulatory factor n=1 Tax=Chromobacterium violaceum TaxID=536 RepID=UPI001E510E7D|nr:anti-sigma regulatory factor [Chromobacterium violaceum]